MVTIYDGNPCETESCGLSTPAGGTVLAMIDEERLERFAVLSGLAAQSVDALRPDFPRMLRYMREQGIAETPDSPLTGEAHAVNVASLLIRQAARHKSDTIAHELRNLTGTRPWKP